MSKRYIAIEDYLDGEEIQNIIKYEIKNSVSNWYTSCKIQDFVSDAISEAVQKNLDETAVEEIKKQSLNVIRRLEKHHVFNDYSYSNGEPSKATRVMLSAINDNRDILDESVKRLLSELSLEDLRYYIEDFIDDVIKNLRKGG